MSAIQSDMHQWADRAILKMQPHLDAQLQDEPLYGLFVLAFDNSKKRGKGKPTQYFECWGYCFPSTGHVWLDTADVQVHDFRSMQQLKDYLGKLGMYSVTWQKEGKDG